MKNSLLADFEELEDSINPKREIEEFINDNYTIFGELQISNEPNENGKYIVDCFTSVYVKNLNIPLLTNNLFEWGKINYTFKCSNCKFLTSLEGAPEEVGGNFNCQGCDSLTSLKGSPRYVGENFDCRDCISLTSLEGAPEEVGGRVLCNILYNLY